MFIVGWILLAGALYGCGRIDGRIVGFKKGYFAGHKDGWRDCDCLRREKALIESLGAEMSASFDQEYLKSLGAEIAPDTQPYDAAGQVDHYPPI